MFKFRRNKKPVESDDDEPMTGKGFSSNKSADGRTTPSSNVEAKKQKPPHKKSLFGVRSRSAPKMRHDSPSKSRFHRSPSEDRTEDGTDAHTASDQEYSLNGRRQQQQQQQYGDEGSEDKTPPMKNGDDDSSCSSYPSVGMNVQPLQQQSQQQTQQRQAPPPRDRPNGGIRRKNSDLRRRGTDERSSSQDGRRRGSVDRGERTERSDDRGNRRPLPRDGRRPKGRSNPNNSTNQNSNSNLNASTNSNNLNNATPAKHRRNNSCSNATHHSSNATVKTVQSEKTSATHGTQNTSGTQNTASSQKSTENAAMQQLAMLVVSLRSDLAKLQIEKEGVERELIESRKRRPPPPPASPKSSAAPQAASNGANLNSQEDPLLSEFRQENIELRADIDAFLLENDMLSKEIAELKEEKEAAEDLICRLKSDAHNMSASFGEKRGSVTRANGASAELEAKVSELNIKLTEMTDENHKLEGELRLMVDEKQELMAQHSNSLSDVALKEKEVERLNVALKDLAEKLLDARNEKKEWEEMVEMESEALEREREEERNAVEKEWEEERARFQTEAEEHKLEVDELKSALMSAEEKLERQLEGEKTLLLLVEQHEEKMQHVLSEKDEEIKLVSRLREEIADMNIVKEELKTELQESNTYISELESELEQKKEGSKADLERYATDVGGYESTLVELREELESSKSENAESQSELKALREVLTSIEHQKREYQKKNNEIDLTNAELKQKVHDLVIQRSKTQTELEKLKEENERMSEELMKKMAEAKVSSVAAVAPAESICSAETVLTLQKMIANLETAKEELEEDVSKKNDLIKAESEKVGELEQKVKVLEEVASTKGEGESTLRRRLSGLLSENEEMKPRIAVLEEENAAYSSEVSKLREDLAQRDESIEEFESSMKRLKSDLDAKAEKISYHEETISSLQQTKERIEADLQEASEAIALLEDELDQKESDVNNAYESVTVLRQKVSQLEKEKATISKSKEELDEKVNDLHTQIKVIEMEKHVSSEEIESLYAAKEKAEEDLHELVQSSGAQISKLHEELDESSDAIALLKEELGIVEHHVADKDATIASLESELAEKNASLQSVEAARAQLQSEHQVTVDTITTLQKNKVELEMKLKDSEDKLSELEEELKISTSQFSDLEDKMNECDDKNAELEEKVSELTDSNEEVQRQLHELIAETSSCGLESTQSGTTSDALLDLRQQIHDLLSERDSALQEVELLKRVSTAICSRQDDDDDVLTEAPEDQDDDMTYHTSAVETKPCENENEEAVSIPLTIEPSKRKKGGNISLGSSNPSTQGGGSSLLEQAKSIVQELEVKRSKTPEAKRASPEVEEQENKLLRRQSHESIKTVHNNIKGTELEGILENVSDPKPASRTNSAASDKKFDIDQLTAIYFEKCGMSASKLSDMSSDASSSVYRRAKPPKDTSKSKKVKICRNGVFMGTYEGDLNPSGQRHGFGVLICDNGNSYEGDWKNDKRDGLGIARYSSGDVYDGEWKKGKRQGHGVMYIEAGDTYIGSWSKGLKHGAGTYHWADGEVDVSWYEEDRRVGQGVRWNATRDKAYQLMRGTRQKEIPLDEAYRTAEKLGLNLAKADSAS